ncbi:MAG: hypothetical protein LC753_10920 [Acidobacteria bacterium]|nr:hypothetical protein [Acidobacteriota bacterium]MCA1650755.1 hypothetical protein [Acidobacteriota bacterium]
MRRLTLAAAASALVFTIASPALADQEPTPPQEQQQMRGERRRSDGHTQRKRNPAERFKKLDINGDGTVSRTEWPRAAEVFDKLDANKDGALTMTELQAGRSKRHRRR